MNKFSQEASLVVISYPDLTLSLEMLTETMENK